MRPELHNSISHFWADLEKYGNLPLETWGKNGNKSVIDLWKEVLHGDSRLEMVNGEVFRTLSHVEVMVFHRHNSHLLQLFEERQVMKDGSQRQRLFPWVAEKIHNPHEEYRTAFHRALAEELRIMDDYWFFAPATHKTVIQHSPSYPGLKTSYDIWQTKAIIGDRAFNAEGYCEVDEKKSTYFRWLPIESFHQRFSSSEQVRAVLAERGHRGQ